MSITIQEGTLRIQENKAEYARQAASNSFDLMKFHGFDRKAGEVSRAILSRKGNDIFDAVIHGVLPVLTKSSGADAYEIRDGQFFPIELKSSYTDESKFCKTAAGAIYSVTQEKILPNGTVFKNNTTSFKSVFNATYEIKGNIDVKDIDVIFTIRDSRNDAIVDCIRIPGANMLAYLKARDIPESGSVPIKLTMCEKLGNYISNDIMENIGLDNWKKSLLPHLPLIKILSPKKQKKSLPIPDSAQ